MIEIIIKNNSKEALESGLKTLKKLCNKDGILKEARDRQYYQKPSDKKRAKVNAWKRKIAQENKKKKYEDK